MYRVRKLFQESSTFQYPKKNIASTESNNISYETLILSSGLCLLPLPPGAYGPAYLWLMMEKVITYCDICEKKKTDLKIIIY